MKKTYSYRRESRQNPYIGFTTFQHFRNGKLYSDIVVKPENHLTETERVEGYPIPAETEENGWAEGFYPDCTVAYIRIFWKDFEPEEGVFRYDFVEDILRQAKEAGQTLMFRLMPHSTRECDDVPVWLKKKIPCPARPDGKRVKDSPTDPLFLRCFGRAVKALGERFDSDPTFDVLDISLPGAWGEGSWADRFPREEIEALIDIYTSSFPNTLLIGQAIAPWAVNYANRTRPVAWRGDGVGEDKHLHLRYPQLVREMYNNWQKAPVSFESYWWLGEWKRKSWSLDEVIKLTLQWHISTFNAKSLPIPPEWKDRIDDWIGEMGYHFQITEMRFPDEIRAGEQIEFRLKIENRGVAPIYHAIPFTWKLKNGEKEYLFPTSVDIREWMPGQTDLILQPTLPEDLVPGEYRIEIGIAGEHLPAVRFCTDAEEDGDDLILGVVKVK